MELEKMINDDIKQAMLAKDIRKLEALRAIKAALLLEKTSKDHSSGEIPESVEMQLLQKLVKQRKESAKVYMESGRNDLADEERYQADIIEKYLPKQLSEEEIRIAVEQIVSDIGAKDMKDIGKVMGVATKQLAGKADNKLIANLVKDILTKP
jgi:uncharacterized protein YqeY